MDTGPITPSLATLLSELVDGAPKSGAYILNAGDPGLLRSLDLLSAEAASATVAGGSSIAAHIEHVRYGLSLMNRWAGGENPFASADWGAAWRRSTVTDAEWSELRTALRKEAREWLAVLQEPRQVERAELNGVIGSIAHLAYHLGAVRQMDRVLKGPHEAN
jgi:hypothetical protein